MIERQDNIIDFGERTELFRALVGSHNYNLNGPESDKDYKVFVAPTFADLYFNKQFAKMYVGEKEDLDVHDIRKLESVLWKANVNFLEILFTKELIINPDIQPNSKKQIEKIFKNKNKIAKMNLPYLYNACMGMHLTKLKQVTKGTEGTKHLVEKYGYDTKQAMHSVRILDFLKRFADTDFEDFKAAIEYDDYGEDKEILLGIKNGVYTLEEFNSLALYTKLSVEKELEEKYKQFKPNEELRQMIIDATKEIVGEEIFKD